MNNFIEVTHNEVGKVLVNLALVTMVEPIIATDLTEGTVLYFTSPDDHIKVRETYEQLKRMIWR